MRANADLLSTLHASRLYPTVLRPNVSGHASPSLMDQALAIEIYVSKRQATANYKNDNTYTSRMCMHQTRQYVDSTRRFLPFLCLAHLGSRNILRASLEQTTRDEGPRGQE